MKISLVFDEMLGDYPEKVDVVDREFFTRSDTDWLVYDRDQEEREQLKSLQAKE